MDHRIPILVTLAAISAPISAQNTAATFVHGGSENHIDISPHEFLANPNSITVEAWVTYDDTTMPVDGLFHWPTIARYDVTPNAESYILRVQAAASNDTRLAFAVRSASTFQEVSWTFNSGDLLNWTHVAATWDGSTGTIYIDGNPVASSPIAGPMQINPSATGLRIGNGDSTVQGNEMWNGEIDELRIWPIARTQNEILETINDELSIVPHTASFNFNNSLDDSSLQFLVGNETGTVPFVPGQALNVASPGGFRYGGATTNCNDALVTAIGSTTRVGNTDFAIYCTGAAPGTTGAVLLAANQLFAPLPFFGIDFWVDVGALIPITPPVSVGANGVAALPIGLSATAQTGLTIHTQFVFIDAACGAQSLTSSEGLTFVTQ